MSKINNSPVWANNAKAKMKRMNIKYKDILHLFGVSTTESIGHYFNGRREPNIANLLSLAEFLNISTGELFLDNVKIQEIKKFRAGANLTDVFKILLRINGTSDQSAKYILGFIEEAGANNKMEVGK